MEHMKAKKRTLTEEEIDNVVIDQADDDSCWGKPENVRPPKAASLKLSAALAARAAFFARLHHEPSLEDWLNRIVRERLDLEEAAYAGLKRELMAESAR